nr:2-amino-4-hydroxy-6-hydroxymethyldihydropteridine diphosphokinase [Desulfovibrio aminophilus]
MGLGSNLGKPEENLNEALARLENYGADIQLKRQSAIYWTEPQGLKDQPWFANQVVELGVDPEIWAPEGLLSTLLAIEAQMGRDRSSETPGGPRVIDLDLLLFGDLVTDTGFLTVPHPRLLTRAFMLVPLREIAPGLMLPGGVAVDTALKALNHRQEGDRIWQD